MSAFFFQTTKLAICQQNFNVQTNVVYRSHGTAMEDLIAFKVKMKKIVLDHVTPTINFNVTMAGALTPSGTAMERLIVEI